MVAHFFIVSLKQAILLIILNVNMDGTNLVLNRGNSSLLHPAPWVRGTLSAHLAKIIQLKNWKQQQGPFTSASFSKYASSALSTKTVVLSYAGRPGTHICDRICTSAWSQAMKDYAFKELCTGHLNISIPSIFTWSEHGGNLLHGVVVERSHLWFIWFISSLKKTLFILLLF